MVTAQELVLKPHSYRGFEPEMFLSAKEESGGREARAALQRVEGGRFEPFLASLSKFFDRLDRDEQILFTKRNPGIVLWIDAWQRLEEFAGYPERVGQAEVLLDPETGVMRDDVTPPPYERVEIEKERSLLESLAFRRRSYRNFTPGEIMDVSERQFTLDEGMVRELHLYDAEIRDNLDYPVDEEGRLVARALLGRIEDGRFEPALSDGHTFFAPLDPDERRTFVRRNPGVTMWISVYGHTNHLIWGGEQLFPMSSVEWPPIEEVADGDDVPVGTDLGAMRDEIERKMGGDESR